MMFQKQVYIAFFVLLRAGLWEKEPDDLSVFPLSEEDWTEIFSLSRKQTVTGIVYRGMHYLSDELLPSESLIVRWVAAIDRIEKANRKMNRELSGLVSLFKDNNICAILQKGQGVALMYERPLLRECGDIDFYFFSKQENRRAAMLMQERGCRLDKQPDGSFCYNWKGVEVEHHPFLFDLRNPFLKGRLFSLMKKKGFSEITLPQNHDTTVTVPSPVLNLLLLNTHIMKHSLGLGIGLRQFCDMARACYCLYGQVDSDEIKAVYRKTGIERWSILLYSFLVDYMGLPVSCQPYFGDTLTSSEVLLDIVLKGGNFGQYSAGRDQARRTRWCRKLHTLGSFCRNYRFSSSYAPAETFWTSIKLFWGQTR